MAPLTQSTQYLPGVLIQRISHMLPTFCNSTTTNRTHIITTTCGFLENPPWITTTAELLPPSHSNKSLKIAFIVLCAIFFTVALLGAIIRMRELFKDIRNLRQDRRLERARTQRAVPMHSMVNTPQGNGSTTQTSRAFSFRKITRVVTWGSTTTTASSSNQPRDIPLETQTPSPPTPAPGPRPPTYDLATEIPPTYNDENGLPRPPPPVYRENTLRPGLLDHRPNDEMLPLDYVADPIPRHNLSLLRNYHRSENRAMANILGNPWTASLEEENGSLDNSASQSEEEVDDDDDGSSSLIVGELDSRSHSANVTEVDEEEMHDQEADDEETDDEEASQSDGGSSGYASSRPMSWRSGSGPSSPSRSPLPPPPSRSASPVASSAGPSSEVIAASAPRVA